MIKNKKRKRKNKKRIKNRVAEIYLDKSMGKIDDPEEAAMKPKPESGEMNDIPNEGSPNQPTPAFNFGSS